MRDLVIDAREDTWQKIVTDRARYGALLGWARAHGIDPNQTYRMEIRPGRRPYVKAFQYVRDERGRMFCSPEHDHRGDPDGCRPVTREHVAALTWRGHAQMLGSRHPRARAVKAAYRRRRR